MAYNNYYPNYFQPMQLPQPPQQTAPQAQQNSGFVSVRSEAEARGTQQHLPV